MWAGLRGADLLSVQSAGKSTMDEAPDVWKLAAIASFSVLAVVLVGGVMIIGVMVHRRRSHRRPLRGETVYTPAPGVVDAAWACTWHARQPKPLTKRFKSLFKSCSCISVKTRPDFHLCGFFFIVLFSSYSPSQTFVFFLSSEPIEETAGPLYHA